MTHGQQNIKYKVNIVNIQSRIQTLLITVFVKPLNIFVSRVTQSALETSLRAGGSFPGRIQNILSPPRVFQNEFEARTAPYSTETVGPFLGDEAAQA
jgi:hypothetical protein